ncbi:dynein regulatory complex subunit 7-like [Daktulosphaira vitifoliae]|uniref:dynein regulatory complex subunit 7-like n=1 Tax=Daktulosphaira vitifoliae TaxID=58002 RepID=UPI0021AACCB1|nr:dynein regulatory complex subunit 7-like [Daktulosphaira vitifoliae]
MRRKKQVLGVTSRVKCEEAQIKLTEDKYISKKPYRCSIPDQKEIESQITNLLKAGLIEETNSPFAAPVTLVYKKEDGCRSRLCIDFRELNKLVVSEPQPFPRIEDIMVKARECTWFSAFDINSAFWSIPIRHKDRKKTAFVTQDGHWQWTCLPFGLKISPAIFQRTLANILRRYNVNDFCINYIDDILVFSKTFEQHVKHIEALLQAINEEDHKPLETLKVKARTDEPLGKLIYYLSQYSFRIIYAPGKENIEADSLSRNPVLENFENEEDILKVVNMVTLEEIISDQQKNAIEIKDSKRVFEKGNIKFKYLKNRQRIYISQEFGLLLIKKIHEYYGHIVDCPESNGLNERLNQTLVNRIRCKINSGDKKAWSKIAEECVEEYNNTTHSVTKFSPSYLLFGVKSYIVPNELQEKTFNLEKDREQAIINSNKNYEKNKKRVDKTGKEHTFKENETLEKEEFSNPLDFTEEFGSHEELNYKINPNHISNDEYLYFNLFSSFNNTFIIENKKYICQYDDNIDKINGNKTTSWLLNNSNKDLDVLLLQKQFIDKINKARFNIHEVQLLWSELIHKALHDNKVISNSYTENKSAEKLIILHAKNFIRHFEAKYPERRKLLIIHENEMGCQKCICTAIKPCRLTYSALSDLESYSVFVANHIKYKPLEDPINVPKQILSPSRVLEVQTGNCFEIATLLVSFLLGLGYNAFIVQGYASKDICTNNFRNVILDIPDKQIQKRIDKIKIENVNEDYAEDTIIDLSSEYIKMGLEENKRESLKFEENYKENTENESDFLHGKRIHCWVMILPLEYQENISTGIYFIEPSTGKQCEISDQNYYKIEAIWNHKNYWVNLQLPDKNCMHYKYAFANSKYWEHLLIDELNHLHYILRPVDSNALYKYLRMPTSWVNMLVISKHRYLMTYPSGKKLILYANAVKELYADYVMPDGLVEKITFYKNHQYEKKTFARELYKYRTDRLVCLDIVYNSYETEMTEYFSYGRKDFLKMHKFYFNENNIEDRRLICFYETTSVESLVEISVDKNLLAIKFNDRLDYLSWRLYEFQTPLEISDNIFKTTKKPKIITEKYLRDKTKPSDIDIAIREFNLEMNTICIEHHYKKERITRSSRIFAKSSNNESNLNIDKTTLLETEVYPHGNQLKPHETDMMINDLLITEQKAINDISRFKSIVTSILQTRCKECSDFQLTSVFDDWDRNLESRQIIKNTINKKELLKIWSMSKKENCWLHIMKKTEQSLILNEVETINKLCLLDFNNYVNSQFFYANNTFIMAYDTFQSIVLSLEDNLTMNTKQIESCFSICSSLRDKLAELILKMERFETKLVERCNNFLLYLNTVQK